MTQSSFRDLGISESLGRALIAENHLTPTPIQTKTIPLLLEGRDLLGVAQTGTGKTAAFALPILQRLAATRVPTGPRSPRALILAPTRELAAQIDERFGAYGRDAGLRRALVFGGVGQGPQVSALARGVDIVIATPGRLLDLFQQRAIRLDKIEVLVLDEGDRMLDMGFIRDVRRIVAALPRQRQSLLFSATMPAEVARLAAEMLRDPVRIEATPEKITVDRITQHVIHVEATGKRALLTQLLADPALARVIVFTRTKRGANRVAEHVSRAGVSVDAIHGNKSQNARTRTMDSFRAGKLRVLVATDIAARGIDVTGVTHVVNFELPHEPESYVHRIGRTARAGAGGIAISFCDAGERGNLRDIERLIRRTIPATVAAALAGGRPGGRGPDERRARRAA